MYKGVNSYSINQLISDKSKLRKKREHKERKARGKRQKRWRWAIAPPTGE